MVQRRNGHLRLHMYVLLGNTYFLKNTYNIWTRFSINEVILENYSHAIPATVLVP